MSNHEPSPRQTFTETVLHLQAEFDEKRVRDMMAAYRPHLEGEFGAPLTARVVDDEAFQDWVASAMNIADLDEPVDPARDAVKYLADHDGASVDEAFRAVLAELQGGAER